MVRSKKAATRGGSGTPSSARRARGLLACAVNLTLSHRAQANLMIKPIQRALGAERNFGSAAVGQTHLSIAGTASWRPKFN